MTNQEIFDKVSKHLLTQAAQSRDEMHCTYRGENGTKCAVGCLIPDELYSTALEGFMASSLVIRTVLLKAGIVESQFELVNELQRIHDTEPAGYWVNSLTKLARFWGLNP